MNKEIKDKYNIKIIDMKTTKDWSSPFLTIDLIGVDVKISNKLFNLYFRITPYDQEKKLEIIYFINIQEKLEEIIDKNDYEEVINVIIKNSCALDARKKEIERYEADSFFD